MRRLSCGALEVNGRVRPPSCSSRPVTGPTQHCAVSESHSCPCVPHPPPLRRSPARPTPLPVYIRPNAASRRRTIHYPAKQISASPRQRGITSPQWNRHSPTPAHAFPSLQFRIPNCLAVPQPTPPKIRPPTDYPSAGGLYDLMDGRARPSPRGRTAPSGRPPARRTRSARRPCLRDSTSRGGSGRDTSPEG